MVESTIAQLVPHQLMRRFILPIGTRDARMDAFNGADFNGTLRYAAANLLFETGAGAGVTERLRITSAGLVGIGTSAPEKKLQVVDTSAGVTTTPLLVQNRGNATSTAAQIALIATGSDFSDGQYAAIKAISGGTGSTANNLAFLTCTSGGTPTERLYISSGGNVGIGTTSPCYKA
jgi:hypothetical protein